MILVPPEVKVLNIDLHGELISAEPGGLPPVTLPTVETLTTAFVGVDPESASEFRRAFKAPNKLSWTIEIEDTPQLPLWKHVDDIFPFWVPNLTLTSMADFKQLSEKMSSTIGDSPYHALNEVNLVIHREFGRSDCDDLRRRIPSVVANLENFSVTYPNGEQGFFGNRSPCAVQVRKVELKNCKGMVEGLMMQLEDKFVEEPGNGNASLVLDGFEVQKLEYPGIDGGPSWASLVLDAEIIRA